MKKLTIKNVALNFGGFYDSVHSNLIDTEIENILETENLEYDQICDYIDFKAIYLEYSKRLVSDFNDRFDLNLKFEQLIQPKEYNFKTDEILVEMSMQDYNYLFLNTDQTSMQLKVQDATAARDGYIPLYNSSELLGEPQFIAEFLLDILMEGVDYASDDWFYYDNQWFYDLIFNAIEKFREKEDKWKNNINIQA